MTAPITPNTLGFNVFTAPGKVMVGERPKPFGEALGFDPITSTLIFGEHDAVSFPGKWPPSWFHLSPMSTTRSRSRATNCASLSRATPTVQIRRRYTFHRSA